MLTQPHEYTLSSSAIHDTYIQMVLKHYDSFEHLGEKPLYQKKYSAAVPKIHLHECLLWHHLDSLQT